MQLIVKAVKPPLVLVTPSDINITIPGSMVVQVIQPNKTMQEAFELGVVSPTIKMTNYDIRWIFSNLTLHFFLYIFLHYFIDSLCCY